LNGVGIGTGIGIGIGTEIGTGIGIGIGTGIGIGIEIKFFVWGLGGKIGCFLHILILEIMDVRCNQQKKGATPVVSVQQYPTDLA